MNKKAYIVDGSGYIFRAYYAVPPLTTANGFPTNALFGFTRMLLKLLSEPDASHVAVVFDAGAKTFRNELYSEYKANRKECPQDLVEQMPLFRSIAEALGLPVLELKGYEADDIIGTLTEKLTQGDIDVVIVSADKDLMQLVNERVSIWDTMRDRRFTRKEVAEKFGVPPEKVVEVLGLMGDDSDNIPGLRGCGPKTATQLIERYGDVATVLASVESIRGDSALRNRAKLADTLEQERATVEVSRRLVEVVKNVPVVVQNNGSPIEVLHTSPEQLISIVARKEPQGDQLRSLGEKLEFSTLFKEIPQPQSTDSSHSLFKVITVYEDNFEECMQELEAQSLIALDTETTSLDTLTAEIVGISYAFTDATAYYIPLGHLPETVAQGRAQVSKVRCLQRLAPILEQPAIGKIGQNLKYDIGVFAREGITLRGVDFDTMIAAYLLNPDQGSYNLTILAREHLHCGLIEYEQVAQGKNSLAEVAIEQVAQYAGQDASLAWRIAQVLRPRIEEKAMSKLMHTIEMPLVGVLSTMERKGVKLDDSLLTTMSQEMALQLVELQQRVFTHAGGEFNLNSPKQLSEVLFTRLAIPTKGLKKTKTGISTDSSVLEKLRTAHPIADELLRYRLIHKLKSTYVDTLPQQISPITGRLHSKFNQTVTGTGRLSSSEPNLQNIPVSSLEGRKIRRAFIAEEGNVLISADYSQIELRVLAHLSEDEQLIAAFAENEDIHARTAREIYGLSSSAEVSSEQRRVGKTINFGVIYGMGAFRLGKELEIPIGVAQTYIDNYFARYPGVKKLFAQLEHDVLTKGEVTTLFGRKRVMASVDTSGRDQGFVVRAAINAPLQGTAADIIKLAMVRVHERLANELPATAMILQIHDELVFEGPEELCTQACKIIREAMEGVAQLLVPLKVDIGWGKNWEEAKG